MHAQTLTTKSTAVSSRGGCSQTGPQFDLLVGTFLACVVLGSVPDTAYSQTGFERPPINYFETEVHDPVAQLARRIKAGEAELRFDEVHGYLPAVLEALDVPTSSQTLVFSKTSLQLQRISPRRPRALYFNDDVYVGYCQRGDVLELAASDARQGATFYTLKQEPSNRPMFVRDRGQCLTCHASNRTQYVPGYLVRSVYPNSMGQPIFGSGTYNTDQTSPIEERWGGWYVTGKHGDMQHMGNQTYREENTRSADFSQGANLESLDSIVSTKPYLSPHSDLIALMVMEHQVQMHNALAAANYETRNALHQSFQMNQLLDRPKGFVSESADRRINGAADRVLNHLLMCDEFELQNPVTGTSAFATEFVKRGPNDSQGRSLREFELTQRLFRFPCSYLIYNAAFDGLPDEVRKRVLNKLADILAGRDASPEYQHLKRDHRTAIHEILIDTKPEYAKLTSKENA